jgi:hypothetical protein
LKTSRLHPMYRVDRAALDPVAMEVADALAHLRQLHVGRNHRPIAKTITMLLEGPAGACWHRSLADWRAGPR